MENKKVPIPFSVSTIFFIIYLALCCIGGSFTWWEGYPRVDFDMLLRLPVTTYIYWGAILVMVVFVFVKRLQIVPMACIATITLVHLYNFIGTAMYARTALLLIEGILSLLAWLLLTLVSIGAVTKRGFKGIGYIWFVPMILQIFAGLVNIFRNFEYAIKYGSSESEVLYYLLIIFTEVFFIVAFCLLCKWFGAVIRNQRIANYAPSKTAPAAPVYTAPTSPAPAPASTSEQLKKYQDYLTQGIITEEEYEAKRKQILGL